MPEIHPVDAKVRRTIDELTEIGVPAKPEQYFFRCDVHPV